MLNDKTREIMKRVLFLFLLSLAWGLAKAGGNYIYWKANGMTNRLPQNENTLKVPSEAVAVDLRGSGDIAKDCFIDASAANPNCIYYMDGDDGLPDGLDENRLIVRDLTIGDFIVDSRYDYYCPIAFKAGTALFNYTPFSELWGGPYPWMSMIMSGVFVLPFDVQRAWLIDTNDVPGTDAGFDSRVLRVYRYIGDEEDVLRFSIVKEQQLNAYEPYLTFLFPSRIAFYGENVTVPVTRTAYAMGNKYDLWCVTSSQPTPQWVYSWYCDHYYFYQGNLSETIRPFSGVVDVRRHLPNHGGYGEPDDSPGGSGGAEIVPPGGSDGGEKVNGEIDDTWQDFPDRLNTILWGEDVYGVGHVESGASQRPPFIYSLSGQRITDTGRLKPGLYIKGGRKVAVK